MASKLEQTFAAQIREHGLTDPEVEYRFHPTRRWRFDFAWPELRLAVEVEGGVFSGGRHVRAVGFIGDCEKYNQAALLGWTVLRYPGKLINEGAAIQEVQSFILSAYESYLTRGTNND